jgi:predicted RNA binding protein YcfA (HicA-like mRNA interferase family)
MGSCEKTLQQLLSGTSDANMSFDDLRQLLLRLGFEERTRGSHRMFRRPGVRELINLQQEGHQAKPYQVRQVRRVIVEYKLAGEV